MITKRLVIIRHVGFRSSSRRKENGFVGAASRFVPAGSNEVCSRNRNRFRRWEVRLSREANERRRSQRASGRRTQRLSNPLLISEAAPRFQE